MDREDRMPNALSALYLSGPCNQGHSDDEESLSPRSVTEDPMAVTGDRRPPQSQPWSKRRGVNLPVAPDTHAKRVCTRLASTTSGLVTRENHPINRGRRAAQCIGLPSKLYHPSDVVGPIMDSMTLLYYKTGWRPRARLRKTVPLLNEVRQSMGVRRASAEDHLFAMGVAPEPTCQPTMSLCSSCHTANPRDFVPTADKSHLVCKCGVVCSAIHIAQEREKNCAKDEDKTAHADKPYDPKTDRFDHPAKTCDELRRERERDAAGTRISNKTKQKLGLGWVQEHSAREAARLERQRQEMSPKDQTKGNHIQLALDKLFTHLEPLDNNVKRFFRMEADRAWREAVRHSQICEARSFCQMRIREKGPAVIADASLSCSLNTLLEGKKTIDGVTRAGLLVIANKLGAQQGHKGTSCALRAVRTIVSALLSHADNDPVPPCPSTVSLATCKPSPTSSISSEPPAWPTTAPASTSLVRTESSASDIESAGKLIRLRDDIVSVFRALGTCMPNSVRDATLRAIQDPAFRLALDAAQQEDDDVGKLPSEGLAYVLLEAVAQQLDARTARSGRRGVPPTLLASFAVSVPRIEAATASVRALLPSLAPVVASDDDGLFD